MRIEESMEKFLDMIKEEQDRNLKSRVTDKLVQLLINNGVKIDGKIIEYRNNPILTKYTLETKESIKLETRVCTGISITGLDFSDHDLSLIHI